VRTLCSPFQRFGQPADLHDVAGKRHWFHRGPCFLRQLGQHGAQRQSVVRVCHQSSCHRRESTIVVELSQVRHGRQLIGDLLFNNFTVQFIDIIIIIIIIITVGDTTYM